VVEAPDLELMIQIDEAFGQFIQVPFLFGIVVHAEPRSRHLLARLIRLAKIP
jgi:hypothetical protein